MVSDVVSPSMVMAVNPAVPAKDFKGLVEAVRQSPGKYAMGSWGAGTQPHQVQVFMDKAYGLQSLHVARSEEHTSELQSPCNLVCRLLLEKKKKRKIPTTILIRSNRYCTLRHRNYSS